MTVRARPASRTPEETVRRLTDAGHIQLGPEDRAVNRRTALGSLLGYATAVTTAVVFGLLDRRRSVPMPAAAVLLGVAAMAASNGPMTLLGITDPRRWSGADWVSDIVPHLAYGVVAGATWRRVNGAGPSRC